MTADVAEAPEKSAKRRGWSLLALALASPLMMTAAGAISAVKAGELTTKVGFVWLLAAGVTGLILKNRDDRSKANGRIVAATLALMMALVSGFTAYHDTQRVDTAKKELLDQFMASTVNAKAAATQSEAIHPEHPAASIQQIAAGSSDADRAVAFLGAMKLRAKQFAETSAALDRKFGEVDFGSVLAPENLVNKTGIQDSRKTLERYKRLIWEREALLKQHYELSEKIIRGMALTEREVNEGMAGLNSKKGPVSEIYAELNTVQYGSVKVSSDLLNFAERGIGRTTLQSGKLVFQSQSELDEYRSLLQALTDVAAKEDVVLQKVNANAQKIKQSMVNEFKK